MANITRSHISEFYKQEVMNKLTYEPDKFYTSYSKNADVNSNAELYLMSRDINPGEVRAVVHLLALEYLRIVRYEEYYNTEGTYALTGSGYMADQLKAGDRIAAYRKQILSLNIPQADIREDTLRDYLRQVKGRLHNFIHDVTYPLYSCHSSCHSARGRR